MSNTMRDLIGELERCIANHARVVFIAVKLLPVDPTTMQPRSGHHNVLIYRPYKRSIELHEPHGDSDVIGLNDALAHVVGVISDHFQRTKLQYSPILYKNAMFVCPAFGLGLQAIECRECSDPSELGYCVFWNIFLMECILLNPELSTIEIIDACIDAVRTPVKMKKMIRAYVLKMAREIKAHNKALNPHETIDIGSRSIKSANFKKYYGHPVTRKANSRSPDFSPDRPEHSPMSKSVKQQLYRHLLGLSAEQQTQACSWFGLEDCQLRDVLTKMIKRGINKEQLDHYLQTFADKKHRLNSTEDKSIKRSRC